MQQCLINNSSLSFFRAASGVLALVAFLVQSQWLILITALLVASGAFSTQSNALYQFHALVLGKLLKERSEPVPKDSGEFKFTSGFAGGLFLVGFLLLYFGKFTGFAWGLILITSFLMFLACFTGVCIASLMYAGFKVVFKR